MTVQEIKEYTEVMLSLTGYPVEPHQRVSIIVAAIAACGAPQKSA